MHDLDIGLRIVPSTEHNERAPCCRCHAVRSPWDRIGNHILCPDCQELLVRGEGEPLTQKLHKDRCAICRTKGTVRCLTYPLHSSRPLEIDLCPAHFREYLSRRLDRSALDTLSRNLQSLGLDLSQIFLLHEAFYDDNGRPIQPIQED